MATVRSLARLAGCSPATVSRALRQDPRLAPATLARITTLAAEHGFPGSRGPLGGPARTLVIVLSHETRLGQSEQHRQALAGLRREARRHAVAVALLYLDPQDPAAAPVVLADPAFSDPRLAGVVIIGGLPESLARSVVGRGPLVTMGHDVDLPGIDAVQADHHRSAETLVAHLATLGHRRIGMLAGRSDSAPNRDRISGYRSALLRHGLDQDAEWLIRPVAGEPAKPECDRAIRLTRGGVTAWLSSGNDGGAPLIAALERARLTVPGQVSVAGFHHTGLLPDGRRPTACPIPFARLGQELLASLADRWQGRSGGRRLLITCPLVRGATTAEPER